MIEAYQHHFLEQIWKALGFVSAEIPLIVRFACSTDHLGHVSFIADDVEELVSLCCDFRNA